MLKMLIILTASTTLPRLKLLHHHHHHHLHRHHYHHHRRRPNYLASTATARVEVEVDPQMADEFQEATTAAVIALRRVAPPKTVVDECCNIPKERNGIRRRRRL